MTTKKTPKKHAGAPKRPIDKRMIYRLHGFLPDQVAKIDALAATERVSQAVIVRRAIDLYFADKPDA